MPQSHLLEDFSSARNLLQDVVLVQLSLDEQSGTGRYKLRGEFARPDVPTANRRVYPRSILEREIKRLLPAMEKRSLFGHLDHPDQGGTKLGASAMVITGLKVEGGIVIGEGEVLDTAAGRDLKAILSAGCRVGVSSRGYGSVREDKDGNMVVQDDFRLASYDVVADPADTNAYPDIVQESLQPGQAITEQDLTAEVARARQDAMAETEVRLRAEFTSELVDHLAQMRPLAEQQVQARLESDPARGNALRVVEEIKRLLVPFILADDEQGILAQQQQVIDRVTRERDAAVNEAATARKDLAETEGLARELGYTLYLERALRDDPDAKLIRTLIGDVKNVPSSADLKKKVESAREELKSRRLREKEEQAARKAAEKEAEQARSKAEKAALESQSRLDRLDKENRELRVQLYAEQCIAGNPQAHRLRGLLKAAKPLTESAVDAVLAKAGRSTPRNEGDGRANARKFLRGTSSSPLREEGGDSRSKGRPVRSSGYNQTGLSKDIFDKMSGLKA